MPKLPYISYDRYTPKLLWMEIDPATPIVGMIEQNAGIGIFFTTITFEVIGVDGIGTYQQQITFLGSEWEIKRRLLKQIECPE